SSTGQAPGASTGHDFISRSAVVGNLVFLSGAAGIDLNTGKVASKQFEKQMTAALDNVRSALEQAGSSMNNLVKSYVFLKSAADCPLMWQTMLEYFRQNAPELVNEPPAACVTEVTALAEPECLVEIDAIAVISRDMPSWEVKKYPSRLRRLGGVNRVYPNIEPGMPPVSSTGQAFMSESVRVGNLLFLSAMDAANPATGKIETKVFEEQWRGALAHARAALDRAGTSMSNIIKTLHFQGKVEGLLAGAQDVFRSHSPASDRLWKTELEYFDMHAPYLMDDPPGSTFLKISSLCNPDALGQTDITAVMSRYMPGWEVRQYPTYIGRRGFPRHMGDIKKYYANTVKIGNLVIVSGQTATDVYTARIESDKFEDQMRVTLSNLKESLEETGSSLENLVKTHMLLPNPKNIESMRKIEAEFYRKYAPILLEEPPASTIVHPLSLASPTMHIEIEAIAYLPA
ncbi:MAG: Rid family hydrolase, partial [Dehalococcoidia bacterium]|nr:Rid family hydrolase [Dehalococcoidia bacterium]